VAKADLHIHTRISDGFATVEETLAYIEHETDLDVVAITDHEDAAGGLRAREIAARHGYRFDVVAGAEITTIQGHVLALFVERTPKSLRPIEHTLDDVHAQGGLAIVPHPMSWMLRSVGEHALERLSLADDGAHRIDGIETHNPSPAARVTARRARLRNRTWGYTAIGASDAHHLPHIGGAWTEFAGNSADDLYRAITLGATRPHMPGYPPLAEIGYGRVALGIVWGLAATPRKMLRPLVPGRLQGKLGA
jgi:hypothetical protein